jgi:aminoglycoside phosphotransferase (APT) family kinase protein
LLAELRDASALRAILGREVRVKARRILQRRRNRRSVAVELADGTCCVLKYDWRAERVAQERSRLGAANLLKGVDTPRLRGATRHFLVQDFIPGEGMDALAKRAEGEARVALFLRAARVLAAIHGTPRDALGDLKLPEPCAPERLAARIRRAWHEIEARGFARWEAQQGSLPAGWRRAFGETRIEQLVADLGASGDACVLGHGDYQPRHLLRSPDDRIFVVDWIAMSRTTPWIELAHLLRWLTPGERDAVTAAYLEAMQRQGLLREVSPARGAALSASGLLYDHLIAAKQMVRKLGRACRPGHLSTFRAGLDALAETAG